MNSRKQATGIVLFILIIVLFAFFFNNLYTGHVGLSIEPNDSIAGWKAAVAAVMFAGMLYLTYHYFLKETIK
ncbi:MAG: hypothetical protein PHH00_04075 [Candidatus Nanoarchaeia archaeon]|nr:hypothetical protein [Candidatus Nanoarchaeia archaeon]